MSESKNRADVAGTSARRHPLLLALVTVLSIETLGVATVAIYLVVELFGGGLFGGGRGSILSGVALALCVAIAAVWLGFIVAGTLRGMAWTRAASIVVQVLLGALAIGSLQGFGARPDIGWALLVPAVIVIVLLFTPPVLAATSGRR